MKRPRLLTVMPAALLLAGCGDESPPLALDPSTAAPALARGAGAQKITELAARETICSLVPGEVRLVDGMIHFQGHRATTRAESDDPRYTGTNTVEFRGHRDAETLDGSGFGRFSFKPDALDGTWEGTFTGTWTGPLFSGRGVAHGTGELSGQTLHVQYEETTAPVDPPCVPAVGTQFRETIRIIDPGA